MEAFSDGVIAVAITLLVLDIVPPHAPRAASHSLLHALLGNWPHYVGVRGLVS